MTSSTLVSHHEHTTKQAIKRATEAIHGLERGITAAVEAISLLSAARRELSDSLITNKNLVTALVDVPLLNGGTRLTVSEAQHVVMALTEFIDEHDDKSVLDNG